MASLSEKELRSVETIAALAEHLADGQVIHHVGFTGRSMLPMLRQGIDSVDLTKAPEQLCKYDLPLYIGPRGKYVMHRIVDVKDGCYICMGDNTYAYEKVRREQIIAVVCAFRRGDKLISAQAWGYRLYCCLWCSALPVRRILIKVIRWFRRRLK